MNYSFLCGSLSRPSLPLLKWAKNPQIIVEPQELEIYKSAHPELEYHVLPESGRGFSYMMNAMIRITIAQGNRFFIFTDDDVFGLKRRKKLEDKFEKVTPDTCHEVLTGLVVEAERSNMAQLAVSFSGASWSAVKPYQNPTGSWGVYVCDAHKALRVGGFDQSLAVFSDWDMSARLIKAGYLCVKTNLVSFEHKMKGMSGGAEAIYAKKERVQASAMALLNRYGSDVAIVKYVPEHGQHEIRFNWRKLQQKTQIKPKS